MNIIINAIMSGLSSIGYGLMYRVPKKSVLGNFFAGTIGTLTYGILWNNFGMTFGAYLIASLMIGVMAEVFARINKLPATVFLAPGLIPLVPGIAIFNMMNAFANKSYAEALSNLSNAASYAMGIALGIVVSSLYSRSLKNYRSYFKLVKIKRISKKKKETDNRDILQ